jgi:dihydropteroate synthase
VNKAQLTWQCRDRVINFQSGALLMGILNVTPDSFSDGGRYADKDRAVARALQMIEEGADIIDIGGESSRPGSLPVDTETELNRVLPVIEEVITKKDTLISIDTQKSAVAEAALKAGAHIINDISALAADKSMPGTARRYKAGVILMHKKGQPHDMQNNPEYIDVVAEVEKHLNERIDFLSREAIPREFAAIDPGIGFGKTIEHNVKLVAHIEELAKCGRPVVMGLSRKKFLGQITGRAINERMASSLGALAFCLLHGASILRVHDVKESRDVISVLNTIIGEYP